MRFARAFLTVGSLMAVAGSTGMASASSHIMMECVSAHGQHQFIGTGPKFVGHHMAMTACADWARQEGKDPAECRIVTCYPVQDDLGFRF